MCIKNEECCINDGGFCRELTGVIIQILKTLQNKWCAAITQSRNHSITRNNQANAFTEITAVQDSFKEQIAHYRSDEGGAELAGGFDPDSDGAISEDEFIEAFPGFLAFLLGRDPPSTPTKSPPVT